MTFSGDATSSLAANRELDGKSTSGRTSSDLVDKQTGSRYPASLQEIMDVDIASPIAHLSKVNHVLHAAKLKLHLKLHTVFRKDVSAFERKYAPVTKFTGCTFFVPYSAYG